MAQSGDTAALVRIILTLRSDQNAMFGRPLSTQAWDLIFVLFLANAEGRSVKSGDAAFIAGIDREVGIRWIGYLREIGVVTGEPVGDGSECIALTPSAIEKIDAFVSRAQAAFHSAST